VSTPPAGSGFAAALASRVLLCDGAMGTLAQAGGVRSEGPGSQLCLLAPELVVALHRRYLDAGADVIETHTYGATRPRLARYGLAERTAEINRAGAALAVAARAERSAEGRPVWVAGSVSPASPGTAAGGTALGPREADDAVREQVAALVEGGVDLVLLETFTTGRELARAVAAVRDVTDLPVVAQATFLADDPHPVTAAGEDPGAVLALLDADLAAVGTNCTLGPQGLLAVLHELGAHTALPLAAQPNAGLPHVLDDRRYVAAGARLVGGCCGTTPEHTAAARAVLDALAGDPAADDLGPGVPPAAGERPPDVPRTRLLVDRPVPVPAATPGGSPVRVGALRGWARAAATRRPFLVGADVAVAGPVDANVDRARAAARGADALWVGRSRLGRAPTSPAALAVAMAEVVDVDVAVSVTGSDAGRLALQADLLGLHALGVRVLVCEAGGVPARGDQPVRDGGWEVDAVPLLRLAQGLNRGIDVDGLDLPGATAFVLGARFSPGAPDQEAETRRVVAEVGAGARFLVSNPVYELDRARDLLAAVRAEVGADAAVPALLTLAPPRDEAHAEYLAHEVPEVVVPTAVLDHLRRDGSRAGIDLAVELGAAAAGLRGELDGVVVRWSGPAAADVLGRVRAGARTVAAGR
jgi:methionine synthase / methylenetetrahydrofolate reductase(NADPH)